MYECQASLLSVVDGDTIDVTVDLGFRIHREIRLRLEGVDTHETYGVAKDSEEYRRGTEAKAFVEAWFDAAEPDEFEWPAVVRTEKTGKFGRCIAGVERKADGANLNADLLARFGAEIRY
jgi:micrococcal nuclease